MHNGAVTGWIKHWALLQSEMCSFSYVAMLSMAKGQGTGKIRLLRFRYIGVLFHIFYFYWGEEYRSSYRGLRYTVKPVLSGHTWGML